MAPNAGEYDLAGRGAIVTGASRGLGREIAVHLARAGAHVAMLARDGQALEQTCALARAQAPASTQILFVQQVDLEDLTSLPSAFADCTRALPGVSILVNNAAIQGPIGPFAAQNPAAWRRVFTVNFLAAAECCRLIIPALKQQGFGKIINLSGGGATGPRVDFSAYASSKAALVRYSETLAEELREHHIDVNCLSPGAMNTRMLQELLAAGPEGAPLEYARAQEQEHQGGTEPALGAELALFLASSKSDGLTGRLLSAVWDDWRALPERCAQLSPTDIYTLRRIVPQDRGLAW